MPLGNGCGGSSTPLKRAKSFSCGARQKRSIWWRGRFGGTVIGAGDEVVVSEMEHHSNIVPWQILCEEKGARLRVIPITDAGELRLDEYERLLGPRTRIVAVTHVSNALGTINPVEDDHPARPRPRDPGARRWRAGCGPHAGRRAGHGLRLLRLFWAQGVRPDGDWRALRPGVAARNDAALSGWRRHDSVGDVRADALQRSALQVRGGHAEHRRRGGARCCD